MAYRRKIVEKQAERFQDLKRDSGLTYEQLSETLGYKNFQYMCAFAKGKRPLSPNAADRIYCKFGLRRDYMLGLDDFRTDDDYRAHLFPIVPREYYEEAYINAWNAILHDIADRGDLELSFSQQAPGYSLDCQFTDKTGASFSIEFSSLRDELVSHALQILRKDLSAPQPQHDVNAVDAAVKET